MGIADPTHQTDDSAPLDVAALAEAAGLPAPGHLDAPPQRRLAVLTCMDARILMNALLGLDQGDMHVLRNAGARVTDDVERSLALSTRALGVRQVAVVHHSRCGAGATDEQLEMALRDTGLEGPIPPLYGAPDPAKALREDVERLRASRLLADGVHVSGYRYDIDTGRLVPLAELEAGA